jgi:hypothetical protein
MKPTTRIDHSTCNRSCESPSRSRKLSRVGILCIVGAAAIWVTGIAVGLQAIHQFESTPGESGTSADSWPVASKIKPIVGKTTLVMLVHPECSCTRASFSELNEIMSRSEGRISAWVLVAKLGLNDDHHALDRNPIAGVNFLADADGREARLFGARTSGQVFLYNSVGHLLYSGGITGARGHAGDNIGRRLLVQAVATGLPQTRQVPVFGCALSDTKKATTPNLSASVAPTSAAAVREAQ